MGKAKRLGIALLVVLTFCLTACATSNITYEDVGGAMCDIHGYDAEALSYIIDSESLYFAGPYFLDEFFKGISTEGSAKLDNNIISISFIRHDDIESGAVNGAGIEFDVDIESETVIRVQSIPFENYTIELSKESMVKIGSQLAGIIRDVQQHLEEEQ